MSSTKGLQRLEQNPRDLYKTPLWVCSAWAKKVVEIMDPPGTVVDLGSGEDARIGVAIREHLVQPTALVPVDTHPPHGVEPLDFLAVDPLSLPGIRKDRPILWVSNPPFSKAQEFLEKVFGNLCRCPPGSVAAFLLRLGILGTRKRAPLWRRYPPDHISMLIPRPTFTGPQKKIGKDGKVRWTSTDSDEYGIFWWASQPTLVRVPAISILERPERTPTWP